VVDISQTPISSKTNNAPYHVGVIGGGITGLAAAYYLQNAPDTSVKVTLLEASSYWGGKIKTDRLETDAGQFIVESGPDSFLTQKPWALQLAQKIGMEDRLLGTNDAQRKVFVLVNNRLVPLPDGVFLIVPTRFAPFAFSPLISPLGKLRMGMDVFIPRKADDADESLADFVRRRLGREALDKLAEPLMAGIYNTEAENQSLLATFPRFRQLEKEHGSLTLGMLAGRRKRPSSPPTSKKYSTFTSFQTGMSEFVETLVPHLTGDLRLNTAVDAIQHNEDGTYTLVTGEDKIVVDAVVVTTPAYSAAELIEPLSGDAAEILKSIRYVSTGTVSLAWKRESIQHALDGFGLVIPRSENRPINAITWTSTKFNHRAPEGHVLLRVFFGGSRNPGAMDWGDDHLMRVVYDELKHIMGIDAPPLFHKIYRWHGGNPQYDVGHLDQMDKLDAALPARLFVAGSAYRGIGVPDCVKQAGDISQKVLAMLGEKA